MSTEAEYFSDRERGPVSRVGERIDCAAWGGIVAAIRGRVSDGSLGIGFPEVCPDGRGITGTDAEAFSLALGAEIPGISWPFDLENTPATLAILDLIEFTFRNVGKPTARNHHSFYGHDHFNYDREQGQFVFRQDINPILARNGLAYEIWDDGRIIRLAATVLREALAVGTFSTGDNTLDSMLEGARKKFLDPNPAVRREALEKLWDAWERLKTIRPGADKKASVTALLNQACSEPRFRTDLEDEGISLTKIGNTFQIRHSETSQVPLTRDAHVDYLFHRMFALIWMLLK